MYPEANFVYDTSMAIDLGRRESQEDAVASDFSSGQAFGFVVLADGMGGHAAGDVASNIVVTEVFSELKLQSGNPQVLESRMGEVLRAAAKTANMRLGSYARKFPITDGMGATLLAPVLVEDRLYWISVGDSPLFLFREGRLRRLNEEHALASQIEYVVSRGIMNREEALAYPDQTCLTSVLVGGEIAQIDCRTSPVVLQKGDLLIAASDGILYLTEAQIESVLRFQRNCSAREISASLMKAIRVLDDPSQDNLSLCVIKVLEQGVRAQAQAQAEAKEPAVTEEKPRSGETISILARIKRHRRATG